MAAIQIATLTESVTLMNQLARLSVLTLAASCVLASPSLAQTNLINMSFPQPDPVSPQPVVASDASFQTLYVVIDDLSGTVSLLASLINTTSLVTEVHVHGPALPGANGPILFTAAVNGDGFFTPASANLFQAPSDQATRDLIRGGLAYLDVHTQLNPNGELRVQLRTHRSFCAGDGGDQAGCSDCPCGNNSPGINRGCTNSAGTGALIVHGGLPSVSTDSYRVMLGGATPNTLAILVSGANALPLNGPCASTSSGIAGVFADGLRCVGGGLARHGARVTEPDGSAGFASGSEGWGGSSPPIGGLIAQGGFAAGQVRNFQVFYRDNPVAVCMSGQNTSNGLQIMVTP